MNTKRIDKSPRRYRSPSRWGALCLMVFLSVGVVAGSVGGYTALRAGYATPTETMVALVGAEELPVSKAQAEQYHVLSAARALDAAGQVSGYVVVTMRQGYKSEIRVQSTFTADTDTLAGMRVLSQHETEYLGARIATEGFAAAFVGRKTPLKLAESAALGAPVDGLSGSTVSAQAVVDAVNDARNFLKNAIQVG